MQAELKSKVQKALNALKQGKLILVADNADREAEGDLIGLSELATPATVNLMTKAGRGLICVPITAERAKQLALPLMVQHNTEHFQTAFTVSVDERQTKTGISAFERATTIRSLGDPTVEATDFERPGHIFPLIGKPGGVLQRAGHTEAALDLARLAGCRTTSAYICETLRSDGKMNRLAELRQLAKRLAVPFLTIDELVAYRYLINDHVVTAEKPVQLPTSHGKFELTGYQSVVDDQLQLLLKTPTQKNGVPLVRLHSECLTGDVLGSQRCDCGAQLNQAMDRIASESGYLLYLRQEGRGIGLKNKLAAYRLQEQGLDTVEANQQLGFDPDERDYGVAAAMLHTQGLTKIRLLTNNPAKIDGLEKYGIQITERVPLEIPAISDDREYLKTKQTKFHHYLHVQKVEEN